MEISDDPSTSDFVRLADGERGRERDAEREEKRGKDRTIIVANYFTPFVVLIKGRLYFRALES